MRAPILLAYLVTFTASFFIMVIELVAGRILAPYIGQHLYSWTSIIGVCLAGISVGAFVGGWIADLSPKKSTLGWILFISGVLVLLIPILTDTICGNLFLRGVWSLMARIVAYTIILFFPSTVMLGMISPMVIKLIMQDLSHTGSTVGRIYAFSTIGSILGTFCTGFILIEEMGTRLLLYLVGAGLIFIAPLVGGIFRKGTQAATVVAILVVASLSVYWGLIDGKQKAEYKRKFGSPVMIYSHDEEKKFWDRFYLKYPYDGYIFTTETNYFTLKVSENDRPDRDTGEERVINDLVLDNLVHSHSDPQDPTYLEYEYLRIYEELVGWQLKRKGTTKHDQLFIGGGGYTLQRFFHHAYKDAHIDVVEIDPGVTKVAEDYMYAPKNDPRLVTVNEDGRLFVLDKQGTGAKYDFIFGDAFNDLSIPFHLTTKEFNVQLKNLLTDNGLLMSLVIDHVARGLFLPSFIKTMREAFGRDNVVLIVIENVKQTGDRSTEENEEYRESKCELDLIPGHTTVIVVASPKQQDWKDFDKYLQNDSKTRTSHVYGPVELDLYLSTRTKEPTWYHKLAGKRKRVKFEPVLLTDDFAPVDNLTAPMFEQKYGFKKK